MNTHIKKKNLKFSFMFLFIYIYIQIMKTLLKKKKHVKICFQIYFYILFNKI